MTPYAFMLLTQLDNKNPSDYLLFIEECLQGGVTLVQLREKNLKSGDLKFFALQLKHLLDSYQIPLVINDNVELCLQIGASGVHLGQRDMSILQARQLLGNKKIIGLSIESEEELQVATTLPVDYIAASAVFPTSTKTNLKKIWGLDGLRFIVQNSPFPVVGIGGITQKNIHSVMETGASGVALIGEVHRSSNPKTTCLQISQILNHQGA